MGNIIIIPNSDFSRNRIVKVDIKKQIEEIVDNQIPASTVSINNPSLKNNDQ